MKRLIKYIPWLIGVVAFTYLTILCVKEYSWVFVSSDSGDFLAASTTWFVPQTYGYPLYILLGHFLNLFPGILASKMTIILSALPAAITVSIVYLTVQKLTQKRIIALVSAIVLLGCAVFLTEASVTKGYALEAMFLSLAFWSYINNWRYRTATFLGLATAVHPTALVIAFFWMLADRRYRYWLKALWLYILIGIIPYLYVPLLMYLDTPRFLAGSLTKSNLLNYLSSTGRAIIGNLSVYEAPARIYNVAKIILMSFGLAVVPLIISLRKPYGRSKLILLAAPLFILWYVITCVDAQTWTYLSLAAPSIAILIGIGLNKMSREHLIAVGACAVILVSVNAAFLNGAVIERQHPYGMNYLSELNALPNHSVVVTEPGPYSLGLFYAITLDKDLVPLVYPYIEQPLFNVTGYDEYLHSKYNVPDWSSTLEGVQWCLDNDVPVYLTVQEQSVILRCFNLSGSGTVEQIVGLTGLQPSKYIVNTSTGIIPITKPEENK